MVWKTGQTLDPDGWPVVRRLRKCNGGHMFTTWECYEYADVEVVFKARDMMAEVRAKIEAGDIAGAIETTLRHI